jgi:hypothetical protein
MDEPTKLPEGAVTWPYLADILPGLVAKVREEFEAQLAKRDTEIVELRKQIDLLRTELDAEHRIRQHAAEVTSKLDQHRAELGQVKRQLAMLASDDDQPALRQ